MTQDELKSDFDTLKATLLAEKKARQWVFRNDPERQAAKVAEIDAAMEIVVRWKDVLKEHCDVDYEQPRLLDVPRRAEYN